jgi:type IX secretion system PorP/SprF family membrane protein
MRIFHPLKWAKSHPPGDLYAIFQKVIHYFFTQINSDIQKLYTFRAMIRRLALLLSVIFSLTLTTLQGQDIHFSQFYMSPMTLNPALTGVMNCNTRFVGNYRNQWASVLGRNAYNTFSVSYDQKTPVGRYDYFGFGANIWTDVAGSLDFQTLTLKLSGSYSRRVGGDRRKSHYIVLGAEGGLAQRSIDFHNAQWPSQNDNGTHNPQLPPGEGDLLGNFMFGDVGLGLLWFSVLGDNHNFYIGGAFNHLNQANLSFRRPDFVEKYYTRTVFHAGGEFPMSRSVSIVPGAVVFNQGPSLEINGGTSFRFNLDRSSDQSFQFGAWMRLARHYEKPLLVDALILSTRFDYDTWGIGFSYDINVSSLSAETRGNGGFEFSAIYTICGPQSRGVYCPRF